ncbi:Rib/alpha-like domain-containing protein, partial [Peptoniphilus lacrimalis]
MSNITNFRTRKNQITKSLKKLMLYLLVISLVLPSLTEVAWAAANPPEVMLRDNQVRAGEAPWKPDNYENGSDAAVMSRTGYCGSVGGARFRGSVKGIHYTEYKNAEDGFGWSRKPGGNDNYADELIRVNAKFDKNTKTIFWNIIVKGQSAGDLMGVTKDLTNPYFIIAISRGLENPKNLYVSNGYRKLKEYPNNWQTLHTGDFRMYDVYKDSDHALYNGRRILGKTDQTKEFLQEKYRLPCTGDNQDKSMAYNIEKYNYYSKYAIIDQQGGLNEANTRMYSFTTELDEGEVAAQGELPNVDSEFTNYMGWGGQRNNVDLSGKVWITVGVTSREARKNTAKPLGTGNYNFSKIAVVDVVPNKDNLGLEPYYNEGSGKAEETVKLPVNLKNSKKFPEGTRFMLESDPKDKFETDHSTGAITQTPAKPNGPISIDQYTGEVTVKIPKGAKGGQEIKDNVHVIYPDGSTHIVPLVVKVIEDKPNIKRGSFATKPKDNEKQLDKVPFEDIYMGDAASKFTYQAGDTSKIIKSFTADGLPSGTTFGVGTQESSNNAPDENGKRFQRSLALKADTKAKVGDFAITFKAVNGSGKETTATNPGVIKTYLPTNNGTKIRIKKGTPEANIPSPEAAIGIYHKKYTNRDDIRNELKTGINKNLIKKDKTGYLPDGTTYTWKNTPKTDVVENNHLYSAYVKYTNKDGKEVVDEVPVYVDVYDTDDVIAYTPNDVTKPTDDKDKNVPKKDSNKDDVDVKDYNLVAFRTEDKTKGTLTKDKEQNKEVISVLVKKNNSKLKTFGSIKPTVNTATDYTFWFWDKDPADVKQVVADKDTYANKDIYTAYFIKSGDEIKEIDKNIPLPNGFHKVTIAKGDGIEDNQLFGKTYAVKEGVKLSKDKFPNINAKQSYKDPKWNVGNPWDQVMGKADVTYTASATKIEYTTDQVIPWIPKDPKNPENDKPTTGKDGKEIPANYITVKFTAQKEAGKALGKVTVGAKTGEEVLAKVKPNTDLSTKTDITATGNNGYGFTKWKPALGVVTDTNKAFEAQFI